MDAKHFDIQSARNLFSKAQKVSFAFLQKTKPGIPSLNLYFSYENTKQARLIFQQLVNNFESENLKLSLIGNDGDYLTVSFLWESRSVIFSSSPDNYNKKEYLEFCSKTLYGQPLKLSFFITGEDGETPVKAYNNGVITYDFKVIYYQFNP